MSADNAHSRPSDKRAAYESKRADTWDRRRPQDCVIASTIAVSALRVGPAATLSIASRTAATSLGRGASHPCNASAHLSTRRTVTKPAIVGVHRASFALMDPSTSRNARCSPRLMGPGGLCMGHNVCYVGVTMQAGCYHIVRQRP